MGLDIDTIRLVTQEMQSALNEFSNTGQCNLADIVNNIRVVLNIWVGKTYIGVKKNVDIEDAFQDFFCILMKFLIHMKTCDVSVCLAFANRVLYQGVVYRYLGTRTGNTKKISLKYSNIYVSWSKSCNVVGDLGKLKNIVRVKSDIKNGFFGIDLTEFGFGVEQEVVFPTIRECVIGLENMKWKNGHVMSM